MITCTAIQTVKRGKEAALERLMKELAETVRANEPGCTLFQSARSEDDPQKFIVLEQYVDEDAFELHRKTAYLKAVIPKMMACLESEPELTTYRTVYPATPPSPPFFHIGIVVRDLEEAAATYSSILGVTFTEPATFHVPIFEDPEPHEQDLVAVFSREGPPYFELLQATGDGIFSERYADQILYAGVWESDVAARIEALKANGIALDAVLRNSDRTPFVVISSPDLLGIRIEFVGDGARAAIENWVETGKFTGEVAS